MSDLHIVAGYGQMEDYYDSDYVPHDLLIRCHALQLELQRRREQQLSMLSKANGLAVTYEDPAATLVSPQVTVSGKNPNSCADQHQALACGVRSPHGVVQRSSGVLSKCTSGGDRGGVCGSANSRIPQPSVELEKIYAARQRSYSSALSAGVPSDDPVLVAPSGGCTASLLSLASSGTAAAAALATSQPVVLSSSPRRCHRRLERQWRRLPHNAYISMLAQSDPYGAATEAHRQEKFLSESKRLGKPFVPSGGSGLDTPTRFMLGDCVKALYRSIAPDWLEANLVVVSTAEDLVALYFSLAKLSKEQVTELLQYMNACLKYNVAIREFHLSKVDEGWDVLTNDAHVLYTLRPPWVKKRVFLPDTVSPPHAHV
ncbi:hypothetical protein JKF63_02050 [Porcisia hertigi]|uniref:Uncharacterized protein n=1 Tax=Porcisia hertigi TaxID=2761500 RepID=A0A836II22_9TRYP|nr:hypothetical protein JKF63_02050 [Porcisia hertigi]